MKLHRCQMWATLLTRESGSSPEVG
jgi:hypothetical protein